MLPATLYPMKGNTMATPTFDTIEAQASYGIGLQVGQQLSESGLEGLLPEALVAGIMPEWSLGTMPWRLLRLMAVVVAGIAAYFAALAVMGFKVKEFARRMHDVR